MDRGRRGTAEGAGLSRSGALHNTGIIEVPKLLVAILTALLIWQFLLPIMETSDNCGKCIKRMIVLDVLF